MMITDVTATWNATYLSPLSVTSFQHNPKAYLYVTSFGTLHNEEMEVAVLWMVPSATAQFLPQQNLYTHAQNGQMHRRAHGWEWWCLIGINELI